MAPRQKFQENWLSNDQFKSWLARVADTPTKAYCQVCHKQLSAEISSLKRHRQSRQHVAFEERLRSTGDCGESKSGNDNGEDSSNDQDRGLSDAVAYATVLFIVFLEEYNLTFSLCDAIMELNRRMFPDSIIAAHMAMKRKKCTSLAQVLADHVVKKLAIKLKKNKFSLIIDESTDCSVDKTCALIVKYFDMDENKIKTMLNILNIHNGNHGSSGESLFNMIINCLNSLQIPLHNMRGFAADGASNIMGSINSVSSRLKKQMPGITIFKCVSHSIHLCSSEAAKTLPRSCEEDLVRNIQFFLLLRNLRERDYHLTSACDSTVQGVRRWGGLRLVVR